MTDAIHFLKFSSGGGARSNHLHKFPTTGARYFNRTLRHGNRFPIGVISTKLVRSALVVTINYFIRVRVYPG